MAAQNVQASCTRSTERRTTVRRVKGNNPLARIFSVRNVGITFLIVNYAVFLFYPIFRAFAGSLHEWNPLVGTYKWVGFSNFQRVMHDGVFWQSIGNTVYYTAFSTLFRVIVGLALALALYAKLCKYKNTFRAIFYMPTITPLVAVSLVWVSMYDPQYGIIDKFFGLDVNWLHSSKTAMPAIIIMTIWKDFGYATVMYLAGLMGLPQDVFEAAEVDGANSWQRFWKITLPLLRPTTLFVVITSLISYMQAYVQILMMTKGGPGKATYTISYLIYDSAFKNYNFGYASAMSIMLFLITAVLTAVMFVASSRNNSESL